MPPKKVSVVYKAHRILIGAGIFVSLVMTYWGFRQWQRHHETQLLVIAGLGVVAAVGLGLYLRSFLRKMAAQ